MNSLSVNHELNEQQLLAVESTANHTLVLAGAGSGKTKVLTHRIAWCIETGQVRPDSILAVTFTNKAAREMQYRIQNLIEMPINKMWVGTFHGICHRLLRIHHEMANLSPQFQIIDTDDQLRIIKRISKEIGLDEATWPARQSQWQINNWKDDGLRSKNIKVDGDFYTETVNKIYKEYEDISQRDHLVDFGELLLKSYETLINSKAVKTFFQTRFKSVLIDEFQDTNTIQ